MFRQASAHMSRVVTAIASPATTGSAFAASRTYAPLCGSPSTQLWQPSLALWYASSNPSQRCSLSTSSHTAYPDIVVPQMGESISEGSIAAFLKKVGEQISMNETIALIDTDKVTIDVKSPVAGTLESVSVAANDVVKPGQVIAVVAEGHSKTSTQDAKPSFSSSSSHEPTSLASPDKQKKENVPSPASPSQPQKEQQAQEKVASHDEHSWKVGIHFPTRRTENGERISDMPAEQALVYMSKHASANSEASVPPAAHDVAGGSAAKATPAAPAARSAAAKASPSVSSSGNAAGAVSIKVAPPRRELSARELEVINLGGAEP